MGFALDDSIVRGDLFTPNGKWKYTVAIDMTGHYDNGLIHDDVRAAYEETPSKVRGVIDGLTGYQLVVLEPCHRYSHPVSMIL